MDPFEGRGAAGAHGWGGAGFLPLLSLLSVAVFLVVAAMTFRYLLRTGRLSLSWLGRPHPEDEAKRVLAERFAHGDISTDEFLERSSVLNWTPGSDSLPSRSRRGGR